MTLAMVMLENIAVRVAAQARALVVAVVVVVERLVPWRRRRPLRCHAVRPIVVIFAGRLGSRPTGESLPRLNGARVATDCAASSACEDGRVTRWEVE